MGVLLLVFFVWLKIGITINTINIANYYVEGLYIKLDKKLILKADNIIIPKRKANPSFDRVDDTLSGVKYLLTFFENISLKSIHFENNVLDIYFHDNILQLSSKDYLIRGNVHREGTMLIGRIPILRLKKHNIIMRGEFSYDLHNDILTTEGKFLLHGISGYFRATKVEEKIDFSFESDTFTDLKSLIDDIDIPLSVKLWIVEKLKAKIYRLRNLTGKGKIVNNQFQLDMDALKAELSLSDVSIDFKEGVAPVVASGLIINYTQKNGLMFDLNSPRYLGKNLDGSKVSIVNLRDENTTLNLNMKFDTRFDKKVQKLLNAYDVNIPIIQRNGTVYATLDMKIGLKKDLFHIVSDVDFRKSKVSIQGVVLPIEKGKLHFEDGLVQLKDIRLSAPEYQGVLNGTINLRDYDANFIFDAEEIVFKSEYETWLKIENETIPLYLSYKQELNIEIPKFAIEIKGRNNETVLNISDLYKVKKYLSDALPIEEGGNIRISTKDFENYDFKGLSKRNSCFIYESSKVCKTRIEFYGKVSKDDVDFYAFNDRLHYNKAKSRIKIKNINIDLKKFLFQAKKSDSKRTNSKKAKNLVILGTNSHLRYEEYKLIVDSYDVEVKPNGDIKAIGSAAGDIVKFTKIGEKVSLQALRIKDKVLHPLINFYGLQKGRYSFSNSGKPEVMMNGEIIVEGGVMSGFKAYNNTLAFINTLPALAMLQKPGYSDEGFTIISGVVEYRMIKRSKIIFDSIYIKGVSATIVGKGEIDLKKNSINIELGIQVARELGEIVGSIPLVGYILVGDAKSITVGLNITGSLDKPVVNVSAAKDILSYPLELIKRTIEAPGRLLTPETSK